jgi:FkbM family methyltransferase
MTPRLYHQVEQAFKQAYLVPFTFLRYGSTHPARAKLHGSDNWIYIDPQDPCAIKKVVHEPLRGKVSTNLVFWRELMTHLQPQVAVDVGLNYGECLFGTNYPTTTRLFGFEANPRLFPHLEQSRRQHPNGTQMTLTNCLVSDVPTEGVPFVVNPKWSGQSSALRQIAGEGNLEYSLSARPADEVVLPALTPATTLLFKMDIEGYESRALRGFQQSLSRVSGAVGMIEFTSRFIRWAGDEPARYFDWLAERFQVYRFVNPKLRLIERVPSYAAIPCKHNDPECADADLILVKPPEGRPWHPAHWQVNDSR